MGVGRRADRDGVDVVGAEHHIHVGGVRHAETTADLRRGRAVDVVHDRQVEAVDPMGDQLGVHPPDPAGAEDGDAHPVGRGHTGVSSGLGTGAYPPPSTVWS